MIICFSCCGCAAAGANSPEANEEIQYDKQTLIDNISRCESRMKYATMMKIAAFGLGYDDTHIVVKIAMQEWNDADIERIYYQKFLDKILAKEALWAARMEEYPEATTVWLYLKDLGYNDYVCAGILGNMMTECGGNTLAFQISAISPDGKYYGICQWSRGYSKVWWTDLESQLNFLRDTIQDQFKTFGKIYQHGFTYKKFLSIEDSRAAALAFAQVYERCNSKSYELRQNNADFAYNYYTSSD